MTNKIREEFEAWWTESMNTIEMDLHRFGNGYSCHETNRCWMSWQASRASLCVELPKQWFDDGLECDLMVANRVLDALDDVGVHYK